MLKMSFSMSHPLQVMKNVHFIRVIQFTRPCNLNTLTPRRYLYWICIYYTSHMINRNLYHPNVLKMIARWKSSFLVLFFFSYTSDTDWPMTSFWKYLLKPRPSFKSKMQQLTTKNSCKKCCRSFVIAHFKRMNTWFLRFDFEKECYKD